MGHLYRVYVALWHSYPCEDMHCSVTKVKTAAQALKVTAAQANFYIFKIPKPPRFGPGRDKLTTY